MTDVVINEQTYRVVVDDGAIVAVTNEVVTVVEVGIQGPPGIDGVTAASYAHTQSTPSSTWTINHNLGFRPA